MIITVVVCAIGTGLGLVGSVAALRSRPAADVPSGVGLSDRLSAAPTRSLVSGERAPDGNPWIGRIALPVAVGLVVGLVTRWPVAGLCGAMAAGTLPSALGTAGSQSAIRRTEAVAVWTELLRDTLTGSAGLAQAIVATAGIAPEEIRVAVSHLADRIMSGVPMDEALRVFAVDIDDPSAEEVTNALRLAATSPAQRLVDLLSALADSTRDQVSMRLRVESSRASARSGVRTVICFSVGFVALLSVGARSYLAPYGSVTGQLVLVIVGGCYATGLMLMIRLVRPPSWRRSSREPLPT